MDYSNLFNTKPLNTSLGANPMAIPNLGTTTSAFPSFMGGNAGTSPLMSTGYMSPAPAAPKPAAVAPQNQQLNPNADISTIPGLSGISTQLGQIQQSLGSIPATGMTTPKNFTTTNPGSTLDSTYMSPGALQDLLDARKAKEHAMMSGSNTDGSANTNLIPSDTLQGQIANQLYQSSLYTPQEQSLIQNGQDLTSQVMAKQLAARRQVKQLQEDGLISKEQGAAFITESQRRSAQELADLAVAQQGNAAQLTAAGLIRQNQVAALTGVMSSIQGQSVAPGSALFNPITGLQFQGAGAAPAQIASYAQQLETSAIQQGTAQYTPDGAIDHNFYYQLANSQLSGGTTAGGAYGASGGMSGGTTGGPSSVNDPGFYDSLPNSVAPAYRQLSNGQSYFDSSNLDAAGLGTARAISKKFGIPILDKEKTAAVEDLQSVENGLVTTQLYFEQLAPNGVLGKLSGTISNPLSKLFSTDYGSLLKAYQNNKDNLFRQISAFAGSHPRLNTTEIITQAQALPTIGSTPFTIDSLKDGINKMTLLKQSIDNIRASIIPNSTGKFQAPSQNVGGTVQTKAGAINTNW